MHIYYGLLVLSFIIYNALIFSFSDTVMEKRIKNKLWRVPLILVNTMLAGLLTTSTSITDVWAYTAFFVILIADIYFLYKEGFLFSFILAAAFAMHFMAVRAIVIALFAMQTGHTVNEIVLNELYVVITMAVTFVFLCFMLWAVIRLIPTKGIKVITENRTLLLLVGAWTLVFNIYLIFYASVYTNPDRHSSLAAIQLCSSVAVLTGFYIVLFFAMKISQLTGYKVRSEELAQEISREKLYRDSIAIGSIVAFEVNLTQNIIIGGLDQYRAMEAASYSNFVITYGQDNVYSEDIPSFTQKNSISYLLMEYQAGKHEMTLEYRHLMADGDYAWVRGVTSLVRDTESGDIKAFIYVKDIDEEKRRQLELLYKAERDSLTGLYNKGTTGKLIAEHLTYNQRNAKGALFIIDVDNFKTINDRLGHTYGDVVLCELSEKLVKCFRGDDIVGRIGGDEFIALMKNATSEKVIAHKAEEICHCFDVVYSGDNAEQYAISSSIGIAVFPKDGDSFEALYKNADIALYEAKSKGKNTFSFYQTDSAFGGYESNRTEIDSQSFAKSFKENRIEYVFKMLYEADNAYSAIHSALELVAKHFNFDRGYIFETSADGKTTSNTFEWCEEGIAPEIGNLQNVPIEAVATANESFYKTRTFVVKSINDLAELERSVLEPQGVKSMFQFGIFDDSLLLGFIGFDNCRNEGAVSDAEIAEIATICNIIATFFVKQRATDRAQKNYQSLLSVMNGIDIYAYVIDSDTYEILYMNQNIAQLSGTHALGKACYEALWDNVHICTDCVASQLTADNSRCVKELYNEKFKMWIQVTASPIEWIDGRNVHLLSIIDITKYKQDT